VRAVSERSRQVRRKLTLEALESRQLLAATLGAGPVIDVTKLPGNQSQEAVAINPTNPNNIVIVANNNAGHGLVESISLDGGVTWKEQTLADGFGVMVPALNDASVQFDSFGNLFLSYVDTSQTGTVIAQSSDDGLSFKCIATLTSPVAITPGEPIPLVDRPRIATGPGSIWVVYHAQVTAGNEQTAEIAVTGAAVTGLGFNKVAVNDFFSNIRLVPNSTATNFPDIAVGPTGTVVVTFQDGEGLAGASTIFTSVDATGLGGNFSNAAATFGTNIGGSDAIPPQPVRGIDAEPRLAYDLSSGPHHGRIYMVYTDSPTISCGCTSVNLAFSDNNGATWSTPTKVNDNVDDSANFLPSLSVDPKTGDVAVAFYSARNDKGTGPGDRDGHPNNDVEMFAALSTDGGLTFSPNLQVAAGPSSAAIAGHNSGQDLGRYTGVAVFNDVIFPAWADNSTTLVGNPDPNNFDIATAKVTILSLVAQGTTLHLTAGVPFTGSVATFTDVAPGANTRTAANYEAFISWGDGTTTIGTIASLGGTSYTVVGSHTYVGARTYPITVTIADPGDLRMVTANSTALVKAAAVSSVSTLGSGPVIDVSKLAGNQSEEAVAINPTNPLNIVIVSNNNAAAGLFESVSFDGGATWKGQTIADGFGTMVPALRNPSLAFDHFGNLFLSYLDTTSTGVVVAVSSDGGQSYKCITTLTSPAPHAPGEAIPLVDRPRIAAGDGSVWLVYHAQLVAGNEASSVTVAAGARVTALGADNVAIGDFLATLQIIKNSSATNFADVAVGPTGSVVLTFQDGIDLAGAASIFTSVNLLGLGGTFTPATFTAPTKIGGLDTIPPQSVRGIDAEARLAYDLSGGPFNGRLYMVYTDSPTISCGCTSVNLIFSDDNGSTWSSPIKVNDNAVDSANFLPSISVDPVTGHVAVAFYSGRNDPGFGPGDRDGHANDDVEMFTALSTDGGVTFSPNLQVSSGPSEAAIANHNAGQDLGRYTGVAVFNDVIFPAWADNSTTLVGNPDPNNFDIATARVTTIFLIAQGTTVNLTTGVPFTGGVAAFEDVGPNAASRNPSDYAASINWGDGTTSNGFIVPVAGTTYAVIGSHTYPLARKYPVTVTITDILDHRSATAFSTAIVKTPLPTSFGFSPSLVAGSVVDVNRMVGNQSEEAIAINPTNPLNIVVLSNQNNAQGLNSTPGIVEAYTFDGGATWTSQTIANGFGSLVPAETDPSIAFDKFGNLFISYIGAQVQTGGIVDVDAIAYSPDGGKDLAPLTTYESAPHLRDVLDQPSIVTGPGTTSPSTVWILFKATNGKLSVAGAPVFGPGEIGPFAPLQAVPGTNAGNFGGISVGPEGQVLVSYQAPIADAGPSMIFSNVDPDGLGGAGFGASIPVPPFSSPLLPSKTSTTFVGGFDPIPAQPVRTIDAGVGIAYDRSGGPFDGRVYLVYTDATALLSPATNIYVRFSDDDGLTWSNPVKVNDDNTLNSHFFPKISVDPVTGNVAVAWYDARNDFGTGLPGDRDGHPNDDVEVFAAVSTNGGQSFSTNVQVATSASSAAIAGHNNGNDFGDYIGLSYFNNVFYPAWADNSVGLPGNPDPNNLDIATARVTTFFNVPITGMPNPAQITGVLNGNKLTNINQPNFIGNTVPGGFVTLFALAAGQTTPIAVGSGLANALGVWDITSIPLPDGTYSFFVTVTTPTGITSPLVQILPGNGMGQLVIETAGPVVTNLQFSPLTGQVVITFQDTVTGLDHATLTNPANYVLTRIKHRNQIFNVTNIAVIPSATTTGPDVVVVTFNNGHKLRGLDYQFRAISGGIRNLAGSALDGEFFGYFPSGDRHAGGDFVARLDSVHHTIFPAQPTPQALLTVGPRAASAPVQAAASNAIAATSASDLHDAAMAQIGIEASLRKRRQ
jgi:hypothetical protein